MLVLFRRIGEEIVIGDEIVVRVCKVHGRGVRLAIDAPPHVPIYRDEVLRRMKVEAACQPNAVDASM